MKNLAFVLSAAFVSLICAFPAASEPFELGEGSERAEIGVKKGERFTLTLRGKGWYLSEYDSSVLGFVSREITAVGREGSSVQGNTEFVFNPFRKGTGHLLFTGKGTETHVLVHVEDTEYGENEPPSPLSAALDYVPEPSPPSAPKAEPHVEEPAVPLAEPAPAPESTPAVPSAEQTPDVKTDSGTVSTPATVSVTMPMTDSVAQKPAQPRASGESSKLEGAMAKQAEGTRNRSKSGKKEPNGEMYYTDKQDRVVEVKYKNEEDSYRRGSKLYQKVQGEEALDEYLKYLAECEKCVHREEAHYRIAELYVNQGKDVEALAYLDVLLRASSSELRLKAYLLRAEIDLRSGNTKRAIEGYAAAWNIDARNKELPEKIADLYYAAKDFDSALPLYEKSIESGNANDEVYFRAASIYDGEGKTRNLEKAYGYYKTLIERFKSSRHVEYARKRVQFLEKNFYNFK